MKDEDYFYSVVCGVTAVTPTNRPKYIRYRYVIDVFGCVFMLSRCFLDFSVGIGAFVIELSHICSFFSWNRNWLA